ncbi:MAG: XRE family transcriptional regulator [Polyangiales bacterium]
MSKITPIRSDDPARRDIAPDDEPDLEERVTSETAEAASPDLVPILGANLRKLRSKRGHSLERLAKLSGVSRAMLSQVELGYSAPTINVIWRIANALGVPFSALLTAPDAATTRVLRAGDARLLTSHDGGFSSRALFPFDSTRRTEFYELRLAPRCIENAAPHAPGTTENLVVVTGSATIKVNGDVVRLATGDAVLFNADVEHTYQNESEQPAVLYLVMTYTHDVGG